MAPEERERSGPAALPHLDERGAARMVDVGGKPVTERMAVADGRLLMAPETRDRILRGDLPKGEVFGTARIAGIQAAKDCSRLIPLCHPLPLTRVELDFEALDQPAAIRARATVAARATTGVEMEALTAVSVALLTVYDMAKSLERGMVLDGIGLQSKRGGSRGDWQRAEGSGPPPQEVARG